MPRFPIGLRGATTAYNANVNTTMRRVHPGRHVFVARDPGASAGDESSLGSLDVLPPANLHGYAEWDFSSVPDPVMFRRFLDATDYRFGCSDDSSTGSYNPARECCVVITNDPANATGERMPELGIQARDCINADFNVDNPDTPPRVSQKLIAAATLLRAMPAPSTPEARNLRREVQALIE